MLVRLDDHGRDRWVVLCTAEGAPRFRVIFRDADGGFRVEDASTGEVKARGSGARVLLARGEMLMQAGALMVLPDEGRALYLSALSGMFYFDVTSSIDALHEERGMCYCYDGSVPVLLDEMMYLPRYPPAAKKSPYEYFYSTNLMTGVAFATFLEQALLLPATKQANPLLGFEALPGFKPETV
jgi:hypothetical protein